MVADSIVESWHLNPGGLVYIVDYIVDHNSNINSSFLKKNLKGCLIQLINLCLMSSLILGNV